jgi:hypothetical protein
MAESGPGLTHMRPEQARMRPTQKPNKFFSAHSAPCSAFSAFSEEDIPARAMPDSHPAMTIHAEATNRGQPAKHTATPTADRRN